MNAKRLSILAAAASAVLAFNAYADNGTASDQPVSDSAITTKVKAELLKDSGTKSTHIHVITKDGVVSLSGTVSSDAEKQKAEEDAKGVSGVRSVANGLKVKEKS
jgi:osmotically-inducible protein OsmY